MRDKPGILKLSQLSTRKEIVCVFLAKSMKHQTADIATLAMSASTTLTITANSTASALEVVTYCISDFRLSCLL